MKRRIPTVIAALALLLAGTAFAGDEVAAEADAPFADAKSVAAQSGKPILVDFYATW